MQRNAMPHHARQTVQLAPISLPFPATQPQAPPAMPKDLWVGQPRAMGAHGHTAPVVTETGHCSLVQLTEINTTKTDGRGQKKLHAKLRTYI